MEQQIELLKNKDEQHSLVLWIHPNGEKEFVVCSYYDESKPIGSRWMWGHYFTDLIEALNYMEQRRRMIMKENINSTSDIPEDGLTLSKIITWMKESGISFISQYETGTTVGIIKDNGKVEEVELPSR